MSTTIQGTLNQLPAIPIAGRNLKFIFSGETWTATVNGNNFSSGTVSTSSIDGGYVLTLKQTHTYIRNRQMPSPEITMHLEYKPGPPVSFRALSGSEVPGEIAQAAQVSGSGSSIRLSTLVLFENGQWNPVLGNVTGTALSENGVYRANSFSFIFENIVDVSNYNRLVIEIVSSAEVDRRISGEILIWHEEGFNTRGGTSNYLFYSLQTISQPAQRRLVLSFNSASQHRGIGPRTRLNLSNFIGFTVNNDWKSPLTILNIYLE